MLTDIAIGICISLYLVFFTIEILNDDINPNEDSQIIPLFIIVVLSIIIAVGFLMSFEKIDPENHRIKEQYYDEEK